MADRILKTATKGAGLMISVSAASMVLDASKKLLKPNKKKNSKKINY